ncbi:MAG: lytic transglycosylase domain-containing protein, partial [Nocardioidaceae bacterium]|nr:lytic transglycosylase domain-containing protein [Nocardioidaceae bacterium]
MVPTSCHLPVSLLAAIGQVESGSLVGHPVDAQHRTSVLGPVLDGNGFAAIRDTDHGRWDGDPTWDRAVGPMQFIPSTWERFGVDGDGDGEANPQDLEDATAATAAYLCYGGRDLSQAPDLRSAVLSYNHSQAYLELVLTYQARYAALGLDDEGVVRGLPTSIALNATPVGTMDGWSSSRTVTHTKHHGSGTKHTSGSPTPVGLPGGSPSSGGP